MLRLNCADNLVMADKLAGNKGFKSYRVISMTCLRLSFFVPFFVLFCNVR